MGSSRYYQIYIQGQVSPGLADWFGGLALQVLPGAACLSGFLPDQSALLGVLDVIHNLGLTLDSVNCLATPPAGVATPSEGDIQ